MDSTPSSTNATPVPAPVPAPPKKATLAFADEGGFYVLTVRIGGQTIKLSLDHEHRDDLVNQLTGVQQGAVRDFELCKPVDVISVTGK